MKKLIFILLFLNIIFGYGQTPTFQSNFEDGNTTPEYGGSALIELSLGHLTVVANPNPDSRNSSNFVLKAQTPQNPARAEYTMSSRTPTVEKTYIYHWLRYHPNDMWTDITVGGGFVGYNQWKTWPCESCGTYDWCDTTICGYCGSGIFNDFNYSSTTAGRYAARAEPDCQNDVIDIPLGQWNEFVLYVYWTTTSTGFWKLWRNDTLKSSGTDMVTLMQYPDGFSFDATCGIRWSNGVYSSWQKSGGMTQDSLTAYVDDIAIYDIDDGYTINDICPLCEGIDTCNGLVVSVSQVNITCNGDDDGSLDITPSGGTAPYSYAWTGGVTSQDTSNLAPGNYTVVVTDDVGCDTTYSYTITEPDVLEITAVVTDEDEGQNNGAINTTTIGGTPSYSWVWNDANTDEDRTGLSAGSYNVTVTDDNACTDYWSGVVDEIPSPVNRCKRLSQYRLGNKIYK